MNLDEYQCTKKGCKWSDFNTTDHGKYPDANGNCTACHILCSEDSNCGAFECGTDYCSYWKKGVCESIADATVNNTRYFTCRKQGSVYLNIDSQKITMYFLRVNIIIYYVRTAH